MFDIKVLKTKFEIENIPSEQRLKLNQHPIFTPWKKFIKK